MSTTREEHAQNMKAVSHSPELERHSRKCCICHHPDRDAIEEEFLHWHRVIWIAQQYDIPDHRSIYRHARAVGLIQARRENLQSALDQHRRAIRRHQTPRPPRYSRPIRAYSCLDAATGRWTEPRKEVAMTYTIQSPENGLAATGGPIPASKTKKEIEEPAVQPDPPTEDEPPLEPPPFIPPPIIQDKEFFDRLAGIDHRPYGRR